MSHLITQQAITLLEHATDTMNGESAKENPEAIREAITLLESTLPANAKDIEYLVAAAHNLDLANDNCDDHWEKCEDLADANDAYNNQLDQGANIVSICAILKSTEY